MRSPATASTTTATATSTTSTATTSSRTTARHRTPTATARTSPASSAHAATTASAAPASPGKPASWPSASLDDQARGTTAAVAAGIRYAVDNGARIVNLSLAGPTSTPDLEEAVRYARAHGVLIVVAVGNDGADLANAPTYPAAYGEDNVLGIAATTRDGGLSSVSDYGPGADVAAPGEQILSTALGGGYEWRTGTSMAAPEVAGALVLLAAARPDLDGNGLRGALLAGVRPTGLPVSSGALDVGAALHNVIAPGAWKSAPDEGLSSYTAATMRRRRKSKSTTAKKKARQAKAKGKTSSKATKKARARARGQGEGPQGRRPRQGQAPRRPPPLSAREQPGAEKRTPAAQPG